MGGIGGTIGGILGAGAGLATGIPGASTIGASLGTGLGQLIEGGSQKKKAKSMLPSPEDVGERALLNALRRRQQAIATGTAYNPQIAAGRQMAKSLKSASFNAGGPVNQGLYSNLMSQTMNNITQQSGQELAQLLGQQGQLATQMANRKADLTLLQRNEMMADAAQNIKDSGQNLPTALNPTGEFKNTSIPKDESDPYAFLKSLYAENEELKKKKKELEDKAKANQGTTEGSE